MFPHFLIFVVSTGRCGTMTLDALCRLSSSALSHHEPHPLMGDLNAILYHDPKQDLWPAIMDKRRKYFQAATVQNVGYVETASQNNFIIPTLLKRLPDCRVVHLVRNPRQVIRSCIRRGTYCPRDRTKRLVPREGTNAHDLWPTYTPYQKNAWRWMEINQLGLELRREYPTRYLCISSERMFVGEKETLYNLYRFIKSRVPDMAAISAVLGKQLNAQKTGVFDPPAAWEKHIWEIIGDTASILGCVAE